MKHQSLKSKKLTSMQLRFFLLASLGMTFSLALSSQTFAQSLPADLHWGTLRCNTIHLREFIAPNGRDTRLSNSALHRQNPIFLALAPINIDLRTSGPHPEAESIGARSQNQNLVSRGYSGQGSDLNPIDLNFGVVVRPAATVPHCREDGSFEGGAAFFSRSSTLADEWAPINDPNNTMGAYPLSDVITPVTTLITNDVNSFSLRMNNATGFSANQRILPFLNPVRLQACRTLMDRARADFNAAHERWVESESLRTQNLARAQALSRRNPRRIVPPNLLQAAVEPVAPITSTVCAQVPASAHGREFGLDLSCELRITQEAQQYCQDLHAEALSATQEAEAFDGGAPAASALESSSETSMDASVP